MAAEWDAIVVGSGPAELTCAAYLAVCGRRVLVLERHDVAGGTGQVFRRKRVHQFDVGTHYLGDCGDDGVLPAILAGLGVAGRVRFHPMDPGGFDRIVTPGGRLDVPAGWDAYRARLSSALPGEAPAIGAFLDVCAAVAGENRARLLGGPPREPDPWQHHTLGALFDHCGLSGRARALLSAQLGNYGSAPSATPVGTHADMLDGLLRGGYYPAGGGQTIVAALVEAIEAHDGALWTGTGVSGVLPGDKGVLLDDGRELRAPVVVTDVAPPRTAPAWLGLATLYVVLDTDEDRPNANVWWWDTDDVDGAFARMRAGALDPAFVALTFPSVKDPEPGAMCPPGHTSFQVITLCPADHALWGVTGDGERYRRTPAYQAAKQLITDRMLDLAERAIGPFRDRVVYLEAATPLTQERYTIAGGGGIGGVVEAAVSGITHASAVVGRALLPEVYRGAVLADPARLPERDADVDPVRVSRGLARRYARGMPRPARQGAPA
jgi:phytoene dehydrogenase-like protein